MIKEMTGDFFRYIVPMELENVDIDHLVLYARRRYTGTTRSSTVAVLKSSYVYEDGPDVLVEIDDDLVS